MKKKETRNT